jgi:hypothetical protein
MKWNNLIKIDKMWITIGYFLPLKSYPLLLDLKSKFAILLVLSSLPLSQDKGSFRLYATIYSWRE